MAVEFVGDGAPTSAAGTDRITLPLPVGLTGGEKLLAFVHHQSSGQPTDATAAGWSRRGPAFIPNDTATRLTALFVREFVPGDTGPTIIASNFGRMCGFVRAVRGIDLASPQSTAYIADGDGGLSLAVPEFAGSGYTVEVWAANFSAGQSYATTAEPPLDDTPNAFSPAPPEDTGVSRSALRVWTGQGAVPAHNIATVGSPAHMSAFQVSFAITPETEHQVWGEAVPYAQTVADDGDPSITLASCFYTTVHAEPWYCVGGRVAIPNDARVLGAGIEVMAWTGSAVDGSPSINLANAPLRLVSTTTPATPGWLEVGWEPFPVLAGQTLVAIGYKFLGVAQDIYLFTASPGTDVVQALDGSNLYLAEASLNGGRSKFRIGSDANSGNSSAWYGTDILISETQQDEGMPCKISDGTALIDAYWKVSDGTRLLTPLGVTQVEPGWSSVTEMLATPEFQIGHRGGSRAFPEMSHFGYVQAAIRNYRGLEISLGRTSDGVWFGLHDENLQRTSPTAPVTAVSAMTWAEVQTYQIQGSICPDNPTTAPRPYATLTELLNTFANDYVIFIDPKYAMGFADELLDIMDTYAGGTNRFVCKFFGVQGGMPEDSSSWALKARNRGYMSWGYFYEDSDFAYAARWDLLGMDFNASQAAWDNLALAAPGKPIIGHVCATQADVDLAFSKGADGVVVSGITTVVKTGI